MKYSNLTLIAFLTIFTCFTQAQQDYEKAVHLSTYFLGAQRSGDNQSWIHGPSHLRDGEVLGVNTDLTGGWHDCGDHIKFNFTGNWAATNYLLGYRLFTAGYPDNYSTAYSAPPANGIPDILDECKIQTDYIIKCYNSGDVVRQVGSGDYDHNGSFAEPVTQSALPTNRGGDPRPVFKSNTCVNIIGSASSSLALMYLSYNNHDFNYADSCLVYAKRFYELGENKTGSCGSLACSSGGNVCYNLSATSSDDEMCMAAICLYEATGENKYLEDARGLYNNSLWAGEIHYYGNMNMLAAIQLYRLTGELSYLNDLKQHFNYHNNPSFATLGFYKYQYSGGWANLQYTGNEAFLAAALHSIRPSETEAYDFVKSNIDFILGDHEGLGNIVPGYSFLIGYNEQGAGYPQHPHHKGAFGSTKTDWSNFTKESNNPGSVDYAFELKGALVGGPTNEGNYIDKIDVFENSEVCTYYNAGFLGAAAYLNMVEGGLITNISELAEASSVKVYPSVTSGTINIEASFAIEMVIIVNSLGEVVMNIKGGNIQQLNLKGLNSGVYFMKCNNSTTYNRFILQ